MEIGKDFQFVRIENACEIPLPGLVLVSSEQEGKHLSVVLVCEHSDRNWVADCLKRGLIVYAEIRKEEINNA